MEKDERAHIRVLTKMRSSVPAERLLAPARPDVIKKAKEVLAVAVAARVACVENLDDAYELAHDLENSELNVVFEFLVKEFAPAEQARKFALSGIQRHLRRLSDFRVRQGNRAQRRTIRAIPLAPPHPPRPEDTTTPDVQSRHES